MATVAPPNNGRTDQLPAERVESPPAMGLSIKGFNYDRLQPKTADNVRAHAAAINRLTGQIAQNCIDVGRHLAAVREELDNQAWGAWLFSEFRWSRRHAGRLIQVAERFGGHPLANDVPPSILAELAAGTTPKSAIAEVSEKVQRGERPTRDATRELIREHRAAEGTPPEPRPEPQDPVDLVRREVNSIAQGLGPKQLLRVGRELERLAARLIDRSKRETTRRPARAIG